MNDLTYGELFCGAGGFSRGFDLLGFRPVFANDFWKPAIETFSANFVTNSKSEFTPVIFEESIESLSAERILTSLNRKNSPKIRKGDLDVLLGGPPCQGYSINSHIRHKNDPRNHLFRHYIRLVRGLAPKVIVLENVPGMLSLDDGAFFEELVEDLGKSIAKDIPGYEIRYKILNAAHYGVPQERYRIVLIGTRKDIVDVIGPVDLPEPKHYSLAKAHFKGGKTQTFHYAIGHRHEEKLKTLHVGNSISHLQRPISVEQAIGDLPPLENGGGVDQSDFSGAKKPKGDYQKEMRREACVLQNHWCRKLCFPNTERIKHIPPGGDWRSIPKYLLPPGMQRALRKDHTSRYGRLVPDELAGTILTKPDPHWGTFIHYDLTQQRLISVREAARLQSFPDSHIFVGTQVDQYRLVGNAVPPFLAKAIGECVLCALQKLNKRGNKSLIDFKIS